MNDFRRFKQELKHANPYRTKSNQFAKKDDYHHLSGELPDDTENNKIEKTKAEKTKIEPLKATAGTAQILTGVKGISDSTSKLLEGKDKNKKAHAKYPELSDKDLKERIDRLRMEQQYSDLSGDTKHIKSGVNLASDIFQTIGALAGIGVSIAIITEAIIRMKGK